MTPPQEASDFTRALDALCTPFGRADERLRAAFGRREPGKLSFCLCGRDFRVAPPPGGVAKTTGSNALSMTDEAHTLARVYEAGVAVPQVVHICAPEDALGPGYIMRFIEGQTIARKILRDDEFADMRPKLAAQCGTMLARLHALETQEWRACPALMPWANWANTPRFCARTATSIQFLNWKSNGWPTMCRPRRRAALCMAIFAWAI